MKTYWTARITFVSFTYSSGHVGAYDKAVDDFYEDAPFSNLWHERCSDHTTHIYIRLTSRTKKNKVLRYIRKFEEKDSNIMWRVVKYSDDIYESDSSSDEYDWVHTLRSGTI